MTVLDARRAWWLWVNLLAVILAVQIAAGVALVLAGAPAEIVTAHQQRVIGAAQAIPWIMIGVGFVFGVYGRPFRWVWVALAALAVLSALFGFMGYMLPWGQVSYLMAAQGVPVTLNHIALVMPVAVMAILGGTLWQMARGAPPMPYRGRYSWIGLGSALVLAAVLVWAMWASYAPIRALVPAEAASGVATSGTRAGGAVAANPLAVPAHILPEWYLLPFYAVLVAMPGKLMGLVAMFAFCTVWLFVPWLDRGAPRAFWQRRGMRWLVPAVAVCVVVLGVAGAMQGAAAIWTARGAFVAVMALLLIGVPWATRLTRPER
ncbi:hypothetical protein [Roseovarius sp.]|uniref:hypothetical protein n=1 Tax=Roseovarius sp. TaxID=1486281 RepID=UPI003D11E862